MRIRRRLYGNTDLISISLGTNIFEYKSPGDAINAGTLYKVLSYAYLYKAEGEIAESLDMDMTVSIVREEKPLKLLRQLGERHSVEQRSKGIYRVDGLPIPLQFVVAKELDRNAHVWVSSLTRTMDRENAYKLLGNCAGLEDDEDRQNADSVVNVASEANIELFKKMIQEGGYMCDELKELLAPEIIEFKIQLARQNEQLADNAARLADKDARLADNAARLADNAARLADSAAEIARLKRMLAEMGVNA